MNLHELFLTEKDAIRSGWIQELQRVSGNLAGRVSQADLMKRADEMSGLLVQALQSSGDNTVDTVDFTILDRFFDEFARDRVEQGFNS
ncbi:MAG TPA: RsbRD N-terminal domain-containing protein, partial [Lysobacter sp.]